MIDWCVAELGLAWAEFRNEESSASVGNSGHTDADDRIVIADSDLFRLVADKPPTARRSNKRRESLHNRLLKSRFEITVRDYRRNKRRLLEKMAAQEQKQRQQQPAQVRESSSRRAFESQSHVVDLFATDDL